MYVHYVDMRVNDGMENGLNSGTQGDTVAAASQTTNGGYALPVDQKWFDSNPEWFSKPHHDYPAADIPVPLGTPVYSMTAGRVTAAPNEYGYGEGVTILGDDGVQYDYGHGSDGGLIVKAGDIVKAGQLIMHSASTGNSTGPHLHVDMKIGGVKHCPQSLLVALGKGLTTLPTPQSLPTSGCSN
jgi:murein DD-endopeptidase MepM/ murein hydrolase activator NlpD